MIKYMGSKRALLNNGLGDILRHESRHAGRLVDLFCGASAVSWFMATRLGKAVLACDLQEYATIMARSVIGRTHTLDHQTLAADWLGAARSDVARTPFWNEALGLARHNGQMDVWHAESRALCSSIERADGLIVHAYGGHYFSACQAAAFDAMLAALPAVGPHREVCRAAMIVSASRCAAAPGHTAQPFKPSPTAEKYLRVAWMRDPFADALSALKAICSLRAVRRGNAVVGNANDVARTLRPTDTVFIDPPYSAVQYSRFYHVLETIARGWCGAVDGVGRYPRPKERPRSNYSLKREAADALSSLCRTLATKGCSAVLTFPGHECSNGLSGPRVEDIASAHYHLRRNTIGSRFSTLGGNSRNRKARRPTQELVLILDVPK